VAVTSPPELPNTVVLENVSKLYGRFAALRSVSARFAARHLYVVLGENGAGKSTLLRVIAGLIEPSHGNVTVLGSTSLHDVNGRMGYMAHAPMLYDELSGMENLQYFARLYGVGEAACEQAMRTVGLDPQLNRRVGQYSQGMRQRLSLARAILNNPQLMLLDEPFSNVDSESSQEMIRLLEQRRDSGATIILVTHQAALLESSADEWISMSAGRIVAQDTRGRGAMAGLPLTQL